MTISHEVPVHALHNWSDHLGMFAASREVAECPLVDKLWNINTHDMVEAHFSVSSLLFNSSAVINANINICISS